MRKPPPLFKFAGSPVFDSDGCSGYLSWLWSDLLGLKPLLRYCCEAHDLSYWKGEGSRLAADIRIACCIGMHGEGWLGRMLIWWPLAIVFFIGIRFGGSQWLPFSWRWRYRERYVDVIRSSIGR